MRTHHLCGSGTTPAHRGPKSIRTEQRRDGETSAKHFRQVRCDSDHILGLRFDLMSLSGHKLSDRSKGAKPLLTIRVLIADDSQSSRALLRAILEGSGYEVFEAENGVQVLERAGGFGPDLLILDLQMPKLDGYAAAKALRKIPA
jgi:PleD family two-component response regulator